MVCHNDVAVHAASCAPLNKALGGEATAGSLLSAAHKLFLEVGWMPKVPDDEAAYEKLCQAADLWRVDGQLQRFGPAMGGRFFR